MSEEPDVLLTTDGPIIKVTFNRPAKFNAMTRPMFEGMRDALEQLRASPDLRVMLITANGKYFSAGMDITTMGRGPEGEGPTGFRARYRQSAWHWLYDEFEYTEKPIVVAHQGPCVGGSLEMSMSCDFRLASEAASYSLPELNMGMIPGSGGTSRLTRTIGAHWARWLVMANLPMSVERALACGLVHDVYKVEEFDEKVRAFCLHLAKQPPEVMGSAKLAIELTRDLDRTQGRNVERLINASLSGGEEQVRMFEQLRARFTKK